MTKLLLLDTVTRPEDFRVSPGKRLEALSVSRQGQHAIRADDQWRICFTGTNDGVHDVEFVDHHQRLAKTRDIPSPQPGTILREGFLEPMGLSADALAKAIHVPRRRIDDICRARQGISANIAVRLGRSFGVDPRWFEAMQAKHDLHVRARRRRRNRQRSPSGMDRPTRPDGRGACRRRRPDPMSRQVASPQ